MNLHRSSMMNRRSMIVAALLAGVSWTAAQERVALQLGGAKFGVTFTETPREPLRRAVLDWVTTSARAVAMYHARFPVPGLEIRVRLAEGRGPSNGTTYGWNGALITITVGRGSVPADFANDWLMPHEMLHLGFPSLAERHNWIEEGVSTYVEPLARARAGLITAEEAWGDLVRGMPQGLPLAGDRGLDFTHTWGRTYWGGAIFCLLADVEIRKRTGNRLGFEHALRAIVRAGGTIESDWKMERVIEVGDRATGVPVLRELYDRMRAAPAPANLDTLWQQLGIERRGRQIFFNDAAPLAHIRAAILPRPIVRPDAAR